jgi:hypothetical protein
MKKAYKVRFEIVGVSKTTFIRGESEEDVLDNLKNSLKVISITSLDEMTDQEKFSHASRLVEKMTVTGLTKDELDQAWRSMPKPKKEQMEFARMSEGLLASLLVGDPGNEDLKIVVSKIRRVNEIDEIVFNATPETHDLKQIASLLLEGLQLTAQIAKVIE